MVKFIYILAMIILAYPNLYARKKPTDYPKAELKVSYNYHKKLIIGSDGVTERDIPMLLLINNEQSKFYCRDTEYKDSLESTPSGRKIRDKFLSEAVNHHLTMGDNSQVRSYAYKIQMYVYKDYAQSENIVYGKGGLMEMGYYHEPFSEMTWEVGDSTKMVLGYECIMATTDYHGRKWTAWFAAEIPIQDGPWKLRGLPGLILEASETSGQHYFVADGIEKTTQPIYPMFRRKEYDKMKRTDMLKGERNFRDNGMSMVKASIGLDLGKDPEPQSEYDFLETDYR